MPRGAEDGRLGVPRHTQKRGLLRRGRRDDVTQGKSGTPRIRFWEMKGSLGVWAPVTNE